jgi:hypothetical protein
MLTATGRVARSVTRHFTTKDGEPGSSGSVVLVDLEDPTRYLKFYCRVDDMPCAGEIVMVGLYARARGGQGGRDPWVSYWATSVEPFATTGSL